MRTLLVAPLLLLALVLASPAPATVRATDRGIVAAVRPSALVLRELDGDLRRFRIGPATLVSLDGYPATILDLQRGDVAYVQYFGTRPAFRVRAFTR